MKENNISIKKILWNNPVSVSHIGRTLPQKIKHKLHVRAWFFHSWCSLFLLLWQDIYQKHLRWGRVCSGSRFDWDGRKCMVVGMVQSLFTGEYCRSCKSRQPGSWEWDSKQGLAGPQEPLPPTALWYPKMPLLLEHHHHHLVTMFKHVSQWGPVTFKS